MMAFASEIERLMKPECKVEKSSSVEGEIMSAGQLKQEGSSMEASSGQMATELECQQRDIVAAHILVQMAYEDAALFHQKLRLHRVKNNMKGKPKTRWKTRGDRIGGGDGHSEVARRKAKLLAKRSCQMNDADSDVLALSAIPCRGRRKYGKLNIGMELSSIQPNYISTNISDDKDDNLGEAYGVLDGHERTSGLGTEYHNSFKEDCHDRLSKLRDKKVGVAGSVNIPRHVKYSVSEEDDDNLYKAWQFLHGHELTERWGNDYQKLVEAGLEDRHDRLGMLSLKNRKRVARSYFKRDGEDVAVPVKMPLKFPFNLGVHNVERPHPVGSPPVPPPVLMKPTSNKKKRFMGGRKRMIATVSPSSEGRRAYFHKEEALRYSVPDKGFCYTALDGRKSVVAPIKMVSSTHRDHVVLKADRPPVVVILCLVRDAAARLPGGMGTRADICTLMRDSQYLVDDVSDEQLHHFASKGLDRLHYEVDPCVKYDGKKWIYLHRGRGEEDFEDDATSYAYTRRRY